MPLAVARRLRPFEQGHPLLEHIDGRIGIARIDIARLGALHPRLGRFHVRVSIGLGEEQGLGDLAKLRAIGAAMDELGRRMQGFHVGLLPASVHQNLLVKISASRPVGQGRVASGNRARLLAAFDPSSHRLFTPR